MSTTIQLVKPTAIPRSTATLMKTGQTISYRTGDDGDIEAGRAVDFFTLATANPFGNTNRFTDELGTQTYTNDWVIDWSTYNGSTVLGWFKTPQGSAIIWDDAIDQALGTFGTFSNCRLPNVMELISIMSFGQVDMLNFTPFNITNKLVWTSSTVLGNTLNAYRTPNSGFMTNASKTATFANQCFLPVRTFTVTGTTLT